MKLQQYNHDKLRVVTNKEIIVKVCRKLYRWRKDEYKRFTQLGSADYDRIIYHIYQYNNWGIKI